MYDINLFFTQAGDGFPLILLHGNEESSEYFVNQINYFSQNYRVIAVDTRGHGKSPRGTAPFTLEQFTDDLKFFLDFYWIKKLHLLGFSDGANIALLFSLKYPDYVKKLILNGADLTPSGVKKTTQIPICIGYAIVSFISLFNKNAVQKKEMLGLMVTQPNIKQESLKNIKIPTLVIVGTNDMIKDSHSKMISDTIPGSEFIRIDGDHFIAAKNSVDFNNAVYKFLKE